MTPTRNPLRPPVNFGNSVIASTVPTLSIHDNQKKSHFSKISHENKRITHVTTTNLQNQSSPTSDEGSLRSAIMRWIREKLSGSPVMSRSVCYFNPVLCLVRRFSCTWNMWTNKRINYLRNSSRSEVKNVAISINFDERRNSWLKSGRRGEEMFSASKWMKIRYEDQRYGRLFFSLVWSKSIVINKRFRKLRPNSHRPGYWVYLRFCDFMPCPLILYDQHEPPTALSSPKLSHCYALRSCFSHFLSPGLWLRRR